MMIRPASFASSFVRRWFVAVLCAAGTLLPAARAADPVELAPGLRYLRVHSLEQSDRDLANALSQPTPLVIDLRYVADEPAAAHALNALNSHPKNPRLYVLVSPATPPAVAKAVSETSTPLVMIGIRDSRPAPGVVVDQSAHDDRAAYDALDQGGSLAALVSGKIEKDHFDEAELVKEFKNGNHDARPPTPGTSGAADANPGAGKAPARMTDRVLQRALHLDHALDALKR